MSDVELDDLFGADDDAQDDQVDRVSEGSDDGAPHRGGSGEASSGGAAPRGSSPDGEPAGGSGEPEDEAALFGELEDEEEGPVDADPVGPAVDVVAPLMARPEPGSVLLLRLPNILHVDTRPYDPAEFDGGVETFVDERGVSRTRPRDINVVRWRYRWGMSTATDCAAMVGRVEVPSAPCMQACTRHQWPRCTAAAAATAQAPPLPPPHAQACGRGRP
jgi:Leo1-like protein